jgi:DNA-binding transcriptional ArsR family regulator
MSSALTALAEPRRRRILKLIAKRPTSVGEIAKHFDVTRSAISQHLTVLKEAALVVERRDGTRRLYELNAKGFEEIQKTLDEFWDASQRKLKTSRRS